MAPTAVPEGAAMRISRTKLSLVLLYVSTVPVVYWGFRPQADREFAVGCWLVFGGVLLVPLLWMRVLRCPRCGRETGRFDNWRPWRPRHFKCRRCGCVMDLSQGGREVPRVRLPL